LKNVQRPPTHSPEQHCPEELQVSPRSEHELAPEQTPETQALLQHSVALVQAVPSDLQWPADEQLAVALSQ
jgi:hypothetical protein